MGGVKDAIHHAATPDLRSETLASEPCLLDLSVASYLADVKDAVQLNVGVRLAG
jgi:hypothetical protein